MLETITEILREYTGNQELTPAEDTQLIADVGLNSLDVVNLACTFEDTFDIEVPDRALKELHTVGDLMRLIEELEAEEPQD